MVQLELADADAQVLVKWGAEDDAARELHEAVAGAADAEGLTHWTRMPIGRDHKTGAQAVLAPVTMDKKSSNALGILLEGCQPRVQPDVAPSSMALVRRRDSN